MDVNNKTIPDQDQVDMTVDDNQAIMERYSSVPDTKNSIIERAYYTCIDYLIQNGLYTLPDETVRDFILNWINDAILAALLDKRKARPLEEIPNRYIAKTIAIKYEPILISWSGKSDDAYVAFYQTEGKDKGIYTSDEQFFRQIVGKYKYVDEHAKEFDDIRTLLSRELKLKKPSTDPDMIFVNNGIFNYKTKHLDEFTPDIISTRKIHVDLQVDVYGYPLKVLACPVIHNNDDGTDWDVDSWLSELSSDKEIGEILLWQVMNAICRPNVNFEKSIIFNNSYGLNGKGTLCVLLKNLVGEGSYASIAFEDFSNGAYLRQLISSVAVICDEVSTDAVIKDAKNLKAIITGDSFSMKALYLDAFTFEFHGLVVECANGIPRCKDTTESFYRRFLIIPFDACFSGKERKYIKDDYMKRQDVLEYCLWKALTQIPDFNKFIEPEACKKELAKYKSDNDPILQFLDEHLNEKTIPWEKIPGAFLFDSYKVWFREQNPSGIPVGSHKFYEKLRQYVKQNFPDYYVSTPGKKIKINKDDNLEGCELIRDYGLDDWANSKRGKSSPEFIKPIFKSGYKNMVIRIGVNEDEEDENEIEAGEPLSETQDYQILLDKFASSEDLPMEERCKIFNEFIEAKIKVQEASA